LPKLSNVPQVDPARCSFAAAALIVLLLTVHLGYENGLAHRALTTASRWWEMRSQSPAGFYLVHLSRTVPVLGWGA
jgi:hypothetical protein